MKSCHLTQPRPHMVLCGADCEGSNLPNLWAKISWRHLEFDKWQQIMLCQILLCCSLIKLFFQVSQFCLLLTPWMHEYALKGFLMWEKSDGFNKFKLELFSKTLFAVKRWYLSVLSACQTPPFLQLSSFPKLRGRRLWILPPTFTSRLSSK